MSWNHSSILFTVLSPEKKIFLLNFDLQRHEILLVCNAVYNDCTGVDAIM